MFCDVDFLSSFIMYTYLKCTSSRAIEKLRCEKRLVEDKYRILKEKYVKLKGEMKATIEKKEQKLRETNQIDEKARQNQATVVDQEASVSQIQQQSDKYESGSYISFIQGLLGLNLNFFSES